MPRYFLSAVLSGAGDDNSVVVTTEAEARALYDQLRARRTRFTDVTLYQVSDAGVVSVVTTAKGTR